MATAWLDESEDAAWRGWLIMSSRVRSRVGHDLQTETGISEPDYAVLVYLSESTGGRVRMTDLAAALEWSKSRLSHQIARMERRGLIQREDCTSDARGSFAVLNCAGRREIERAAPLHVASVRRHFIDLLDAEELAQLTAISSRVNDLLLEGQESECTGDDAGEAGDDLGCGA